MQDTIVIGHKNPDTDSICSAIAYAQLKSQLAPNTSFVAGRCGQLNKQTRYILERFGVPAPRFLRDVHPRVRDALQEEAVWAHCNTPIFQVMRNIDEKRIRITPIVDDHGIFNGVVSILEVAEFFLEKDTVHHPNFLIRPENFPAVLPGTFHREGELEEFPARIFAAAMPSERAVERFERMQSDDILLITGKRRDILEYAIRKQFPAIILTGIEGPDDLDIDFSSYRGWVYISQWDTAETLRRCTLAVPCKSIMNRDVPVATPEMLFEEARDIVASSEHKGLPVLDEQRRLLGMVTRTNFLHRPQPRLVLMDHNELAQAVDGAENARIVEIVDHHRLGSLKTTHPIHVLAKPVGSTCTLVYQQYRFHGVTPDPVTAGLLLCGILSDTVITKSPTTTVEDTDALERLATLAGVDSQKLGLEIFSASDSLANAEPRAVVNGDLKIYSEFGVSVGIAQVEVVTLSEPAEIYQQLQAALDDLRSSRKLDWTMLLITDIIKEESILLTSAYPCGEQRLSYGRRDDHVYHLPGVLSRKKQLLPEILRILEECGNETLRK